MNKESDNKSDHLVEFGYGSGADINDYNKLNIESGRASSSTKKSISPHTCKFQCNSNENMYVKLIRYNWGGNGTTKTKKFEGNTMQSSKRKQEQKEKKNKATNVNKRIYGIKSKRNHHKAHTRAHKHGSSNYYKQYI